MPPSLEIENSYEGVIAGVDEAGRGPLAGPVVSAAVILDPHHYPQGLDDSKKLSAPKREILFNQLQRCAIVSVGMASVAEIDAINILNATKLSMARAVAGLKTSPAIVLVDGNQPFTSPARVIPIVKGDGISLSIAAASIIAKVTRDRLMADLHAQYPFYGWHRNAGYGTKAHKEGILAHGITAHHRRSFAPIRQWHEGQKDDSALTSPDGST